MKYYLKIHFIVDGNHYYARGTAPCTEKAFQEGEFSERYIRESAYCIISGYMNLKNLQGNPELFSWMFECINN